jgi:Cdc6-like AAA superfamily ATPase
LRVGRLTTLSGQRVDGKRLVEEDTGLSLQDTTATLQEISRWSIEAKEEDNDRYFFHFADVNLIENGRRNYVIGRKGTGKTAIAEHIHSQQSSNIFAKSLSFADFPFNILYECADKEYTPPNQYITIWEYVIYACICSMMATNHEISKTSPVNLANVFDVDIEKALSRSIKTITSPGFGINILGVGATKSPGVQTDIRQGWKDKVDGIRDFIRKYIDNSVYYILFDALDEDYKDVLEPDRKQKYFELLVGLFKAAQNVRFSTDNLQAKIIPVVFIRDDIFDLCRDPDKNKWLDRSITLKWDVNSLESLIAFRIARAHQEDASATSFDKTWRTIFQSTTIRTNRRYQRNEEAFKFMLRSTFYRPRDIISYVRECAAIARQRGLSKISSEIIKQADEAQSEYMRREVIDEMHSIVDDVGEILDLFSEMRKAILPIEEFRDTYEEFYSRASRKSPLTASEILKLLYHFNVIGNVTTGNHQVFAYSANKKTINFRENVCVHRGLLKCLHIF